MISPRNPLRYQTLEISARTTMGFLRVQWNPVNPSPVNPSSSFIRHISLVQKRICLLWSKINPVNPSQNPVNPSHIFSNDQNLTHFRHFKPIFWKKNPRTTSFMPLDSDIMSNLDIYGVKMTKKYEFGSVVSFELDLRNWICLVRHRPPLYI